MGIVKEEAKKLIDQLPEEATWDDLMYQLYIRKKIDKGLDALKEGKVEPALQDVEEIHSFIGKDSDIYAVRVLEKIFEAVDNLDEHPRLHD